MFISHRSLDEAFAEMIQDFLICCGVSRDCIFCSSLPGNDVKENIPKEVYDRLKESAVMILVLSNNYYESAYCLNEAGVAWYMREDVAVVPIGLPEINENNMIGFIDKGFILRRLNKDTDVSYIYDVVAGKLKLESQGHTVITAETSKIKRRYNEYLKKDKKNPITEGESCDEDRWEKISSDSDELTDGEYLVYELLKKKSATVSEIATYLGVTDYSAKRIIVSLMNKKPIITTRKGRKVEYGAV